MGNIDAMYLEEFMVQVLRIVKHPHIDSDLFGFIRLYIAFKEGYTYCKAYNTKFLLAKRYTQIQLNETIENIAKVPFDEKHQALAEFAIKVIYESKQCRQDDFDILYAMGWSQKDVFDAVEHAGAILRNGRILTAYSIKES